VEVCRWNEDIVVRSEWDGGTTTYWPRIAEPLVFHLFGDFASARDPSGRYRARSFVLTEDDHFDYLFSIGRLAPSLPPPVLQALTDNALLFLGFRVDTWSFRVLLRSIANMGFGDRRQKPHVAVQVDPADPATRDPDGARKYLEAYLGLADISIFEGTVDELLTELRARMP
jgi:hypothetical protein